MQLFKDKQLRKEFEELKEQVCSKLSSLEKENKELRMEKNALSNSYKALKSQYETLSTQLDEHLNPQDGLNEPVQEVPEPLTFWNIIHRRVLSEEI